jgi:serine protease Do
LVRRFTQLEILRDLTKNISKGIISNKYEKNGIAILQTTAAISPGSSGGGLFDKNRNLIGITFLKDEEKGAEGLGFAIPTELILEAIEPKGQLSNQPATPSDQEVSSSSSRQQSASEGIAPAQSSHLVPKSNNSSNPTKH